MLRTVLFWLHLACGVVAGVVIGVMSFTGAALAFEKEILAWAERDARQVANVGPALPLEELVRRVREARPDLRFQTLVLNRDPSAAIQLSTGGGRGGPGTAPVTTLYVDPATATLREANAPRMRAFLRAMNTWHRSLGLEGERRALGRAITGAGNVAFVALVLTGLVLWWPRRWTVATLRAVTVPRLRLHGKARDFNWHNALGLWSAPVLFVVTLTALPISYRWASDGVYRLTGNPPPTPGAPGQAPGQSTPVTVPKPPTDAARLNETQLIAATQRAVPTWEQITLRLRADSPGAANPAARRNREGESVGSSPAGSEGANRTAAREGAGPQAIAVTVKESSRWPRTATMTLQLNPFTGDVLAKETFSDQNGGRRLRTWTRFLHTGEALGWPGQLLAGFASLAAVVLMYTGLALSFRRFFARRAA